MDLCHCTPSLCPHVPCGGVWCAAPESVCRHPRADCVRAAASRAGFEVAPVLADLMIASQEWQAVKCTENIVMSSWK